MIKLGKRCAQIRSCDGPACKGNIYGFISKACCQPVIVPGKQFRFNQIGNVVVRSRLIQRIEHRL